MGTGRSETAIHPRASQRVKDGTKRPSGNVYTALSSTPAKSPTTSMASHQTPSYFIASARGIGGKKKPPVRISCMETRSAARLVDLRQNSTRLTANHTLVVVTNRRVVTES